MVFAACISLCIVFVCLVFNSMPNSHYPSYVYIKAVGKQWYNEHQHTQLGFDDIRQPVLTTWSCYSTHMAICCWWQILTRIRRGWAGGIFRNHKQYHQILFNHKTFCPATTICCYYILLTLQLLLLLLLMQIILPWTRLLLHVLLLILLLL